MRRFAAFWSAIILTLGSAACGPRTPEAHIERARSYLATHELPSAIIELKNALQLAPDLAEARVLLGETYHSLGDLEPAQKELERALALGMQPERVLPTLLETKADLGKNQDVLAALEELPLTPRYQALRGQVRLAMHDRLGARQDFEGALATDPALPRAYLGLAHMVKEGTDGDRDHARSVLSRGTIAVPQSGLLWLALGDLELEVGNGGAARVAFEHARALPGNSSRAELGLAAGYLLEGNVEESSRLVTAVMARAPRYWRAHYMRGVIALRTNDWRVADDAFRRVLNARPHHRQALLHLARVKREQSQLLQARELLEQYVALEPNDLAVRVSLASVRLQSGDLGGATRDYEALIASRPDDPILWNNLAWAYLQQQDARAEPSARRALALRPGDPYIGHTLGWILTNTSGAGADGEALELLQAAVAAEQSPSFLYHLAVAQRRAGQPRDAARSIVRALAFPDFAERDAARSLAQDLGID